MDDSFRKGTPRRSRWRSANSNQALEGKNVKDILLNVGSGGGAAAAPSGGAGAGAGGAVDAPEAKQEEKKEEGKRRFESMNWQFADELPQKKRSRTMIWASGCSTRSDGVAGLPRLELMILQSLKRNRCFDVNSNGILQDPEMANLILLVQ